MPTRKRSSARAAVAAAISLMTVTGLGVGQAHGTPSGGAIHSKSTTGVNGSSALNTHRALTQSPGEAAVGSAEMGPRPTAHGHEPKPPYGHKPEPPYGHKPEPPDGHKPEPPAARAALAKLQERITDYVAQNPGAPYTFVNFLDSATGRIVLDTDAPANVLSQLTDFSGEPESEAQAIRDMQVNQGVTTRDLQSRQDDAPPFSGGAALLGPHPDIPFFNSTCSSGYAVENSEGRFMVTAGHCFANGAEVSTPSENTYGTVSGRRSGSLIGRDVELIGGEEYSGRIFTGGVNDSTRIPVVGAEPADLGGSYCHSGATTGEVCGHEVQTTNTLACTLGIDVDLIPPAVRPRVACVTRAIAFTGGDLAEGGDSGGPFYSKEDGQAIIHGHVISGSPLRTIVEPWTVVRDLYNARIVTEEP